MTIPHYANRLRNLCDEAAVDYPAMEKLLLREPGPAVYQHTTRPSCHRERWAILLAVHNLCTLVGLADSHDTTVVVPQSVLEKQEEALNNNLRHLWKHKYAIPNRKNKTRPGAKGSTGDGQAGSQHRPSVPKVQRSPAESQAKRTSA